jgi:molecular chaperone DnaK (HSP70)
VFKRWPSGANTSDATPTILAYDENITRVAAWGSLVEDHQKQRYADFKLLLRATNDDDEVDDLAGKLQATSIRVPSNLLPPGKSAVQVTADFLRSIREYLWTVLCDTYSEKYMKAHTISFVLTVPDQLSAHTKARFLRAALKAGFPLNVELVTEATALGLYCATMSIHLSHQLDPGSKFICKAQECPELTHSMQYWRRYRGGECI